MGARLSGTDLQNQLNILTSVGVVGDLTDGRLLQRLLSAHDGGAHAAFTALVERHGPMVLGVCREVLGDSPDVHDAFQATFLVLFRKAGSVRNADSVASWLHGVAFRVARRAKADAFRRGAFERRGAEMRALRSDRAAERPESWAELHEEIARLPQRYREPLVLVYLEGMTTEAVAQRLRCPKGTILSRLSRGRDRLRDRLVRRGLAPPASLVTRARPSETVPARVPEPLLSATVQLVTGLLKESTPAGLVSASVVSLTEGALRAMLWTKLTMGGLVGLALATLVIGAEAALAYQETTNAGRSVPSQKAPAEPVTPVARSSDPAKLTGSSAAVIVSLPPRAELHDFLRRASSEAISLSKSKPGEASSSCLTTIATAQAKASDLDGARATFAVAATEAEGGFGGAPDPWKLERVGRFEAQSGLKGEARATLQRAVKVLPGVVGDHSRASSTVDAFTAIVEQQAELGAREDARKTVALLLEFSKPLIESSKIEYVHDATAMAIAAALAAVGDFEAAFAWSEGLQNAGSVLRNTADFGSKNHEGYVLGKIADTGSKNLDRIVARRFVREAAERLAKMELADQKCGLSDLALAQARIGDFEAARRSAKAIGVGPSRDRYFITGEQPYALIRVADVQHLAGDTAGARETLRDALRLVRDHPRMRGRDGHLSKIVYAQLADGDIDGAIQSVAAAAVNRPYRLAWIARAQAATGEIAVSQANFARALNDAVLAVQHPPAPNPAATISPGVSKDMSRLMDVAEIQAMAGDIAGALRTVRSYDDEFYRRSALQKVVFARATAGDVGGALRLALDEAKTPEQRLAALEGLGQGVDARLSVKSLEPRSR
jgi:RNA polymerase sigma factor (sigma-70 family)